MPRAPHGLKRRWIRRFAGRRARLHRPGVVEPYEEEVRARPAPRKPAAVQRFQPALGLAVVLWSFVFATLCLTSGTKPIAGDASLMCAAASSLLNEGTLAVQPTRRDVSPGPDGRHYVKYPLLTVLQCLPALMLRDAVERRAPGDPALYVLAPQLVPHAIAALLAVGAFYLGLQLGLPAAAGVAFALLVTFTTPVWVGARSLYSETLQAMLTMWWMVAALRARDPSRWGAWAALGILCGLALNAKITLLVLPLAAFVDQLHERWTAARFRAALVALPGVLFGAGAFLAYNHARYGDVFAQGYGAHADGELGFSVPLASGVYGLLFSSGKSVFLYAPLLLAAAWAVPSWYRERRRDLWLIAIPSLFTLLVIGKWWAWSGDWGWGPRLLLPVVPLACVPIVRWLGPAVRWRPRLSIAALAAIGSYVQVLALCIEPSEYLHMVRHPHRVAMGKHPDAPEVRDALLLSHFIPEFNPIVSQHWLVMRYFTGDDSQRDHPWASLGIRSWRPKHVPAPEHLSFWVNGGSSRVALALQLVFLLAALGLAVVLAWQLRREGRAERLRARTAQVLEPSS